MYQIVIAIQIFSILALFTECWVVFRNLKSPLHSCLLMACISMLVNNVGYLLELLSRSEDSYIASLKMSYFGRAWICFWLWLFITELVKIKIPYSIKSILAISNVATYVAIITTKATGLYYKKETAFYLKGLFPVFVHENGIWHTCWNVFLLLYMISGIIFLIRAYRIEKLPLEKKSLLTVIIAITTLSFSFVLETTHVIPGTEVYDETMLGFPIAAILMLVGIFRFNLLDTESLAKDYVIDELAEGIIAVDTSGDLKYFNKPAKNLFPKLTADPREILILLENGVRTQEPLRIVGRIYSVSANTLFDHNDVAGKLFSLSDDTEHFQYMEELEEQKKRADAANRAKSSFLANMSHEIRTPINAVLGMDEMILRESREKDIRSYASDIKTAGKTLLFLINDILDLSKIEEGRMEIIPTQYELSSVIYDPVSMVRDRAEKKGLLLEVDTDPDVPHVLYGDDIRIRQIALNLLTNAVKYTEKGKVSLKVGYTRADDENIRLKFTVSDTGIGLKEEDMEKLFSPFSRLEEKRNRFIEGTGLGMSIVKQLLDLMGSRLDVKSVYGEGSVFSFEILQKVIEWEPMGDVASRIENRSEDEVYHELFRAPDARILVVDDTEVNLTVIKNLLKKTEIVIDTADSGSEGLELHRQNDYDIIFVDHMMPDMDGIETLGKMFEQKKTGSCTYIALTANAVSGARQMYLDAGFTDYLSKPVEGKQLEDTIMKYLPKDKVKAAPVQEEDYVDVEADIKPEEKKDVISALRLIPELNVDRGLSSCGSEEGYLSVIEVFHQTAGDKADEIEALFHKKDIAGYTIKVHALKSSARIIGALELSELSKDLEAAGDAKDVERIERDTDKLLGMFRDLDRQLSVLDPDLADLKELTPAMRKDAFMTLKEVSGSMDYDLVDGILRDLRGYALLPGDKGFIEEIEKRLMEFDFDGIGKIAGRALEKED